MTIGRSRYIAIGRANVLRLVLLAALGPWVVSAEATEVVEWRNVPISLVLSVGEERVLAFPDHVQVGIPPSLMPSSFRTQSTGGTVLWLARQPFETQRLQVRLLSTGHVILFDVTAVEGESQANFEPIEVRFPDSISGLSEAGPSRTLTPVVLTRFAAQQLYAPERLLADIPGIRRVPMGAQETVALYRHHQVIANPLGSWQGGGLTVTAVKLTNRSAERILLDPRLLRGRFITAAFQHNTLGAADSRSETTCVYLVTDRPFTASVLSTPSKHVGESGSED